MGTHTAFDQSSLLLGVVALVFSSLASGNVTISDKGQRLHSLHFHSTPACRLKRHSARHTIRFWAFLSATVWSLSVLFSPSTRCPWFSSFCSGNEMRHQHLSLGFEVFIALYTLPDHTQEARRAKQTSRQYAESFQIVCRSRSAISFVLFSPKAPDTLWRSPFCFSFFLYTSYTQKSIVSFTCISLGIWQLSCSLLHNIDVKQNVFLSRAYYLVCFLWRLCQSYHFPSWSDSSILPVWAQAKGIPHLWGELTSDSRTVRSQ